MDEQPSIRTNTTICLGKIAHCLSDATRQRVLIPAFMRVRHKQEIDRVCVEIWSGLIVHLRRPSELSSLC